MGLDTLWGVRGKVGADPKGYASRCLHDVGNGARGNDLGMPVPVLMVHSCVIGMCVSKT